MKPLEAVGAKPPSCHSDPTGISGGGSRDLIVGDVVDLESAGVDVAQYQVGAAGAADRGNACELPVRADRECDGSDTREPVAGDVVDYQCARVTVAQYEIAFTGVAAEIADAGELPFQADLADVGRADGLIVAYVVDLEVAGTGVAKDHVGRAGVAAEISDTRELPVQADTPDVLGRADELIVDLCCRTGTHPEVSHSVGDRCSAASCRFCRVGY